MNTDPASTGPRFSVIFVVDNGGTLSSMGVVRLAADDPATAWAAAEKTVTRAYQDSGIDIDETYVDIVTVALGEVRLTADPVQGRGVNVIDVAVDGTYTVSGPAVTASG